MAKEDIIEIAGKRLLRLSTFAEDMGLHIRTVQLWARDHDTGALPPMLRLRKLVPFDSVTSPLAPSVAVQINVAAMLEVDVK